MSIWQENNSKSFLIVPSITEKVSNSLKGISLPSVSSVNTLAFLYSKYTKAFTDEYRMNIYTGKEDKEVW